MGDRSEGTQNGVPSVFLCEMKRKGSAKVRLRHNHGNACVSCAMVHRRYTHDGQRCDGASQGHRHTHGGHMCDGASQGNR